MKIRTKLTLWIGILLSLIVLVTALGVGYVNKIKKNTDNILASNHLSIQYAQSMLDALNASFENKEAIKDFQKYLEYQEYKTSDVNLSEPLSDIKKNFPLFLEQPGNKDVEMKIRSDIAKIMQINMDAIFTKSKFASHTARSAITQISIFGLICFFAACILFFRLPRSIAGPISQLVEGTQEIARSNYNHRIVISGNGEFKKLADSFNAMTSKLEEYEDVSISKLLIERRRIETIINAIDDPILILDENSEIVFINLVALKLSGLPSDKVLEKNIHELSKSNLFFKKVLRGVFPISGKPAAKPELKFAVDGGEDYFEAKYLDLSTGSLEHQEERKIGTIVLLQNITAHKKLDIAKTNFIASMSHNFKTPIASSQIGLHLLRKEQTGPLNADQRQLIDSIEEDIQKLLTITSDLLKISEVESENIQLKITSIDLREIIDYAINTIRRQAERKDIRLEVAVSDELPNIMGDAEKIAWVLINLISNAIRYSYSNSTVSLQAKELNGYIHLRVQDQGQGIPPEYTEKIFARYFRTPDTNEKGTGLGLAISRDFMIAQGGSIEVESEIGKGSSFTVILKKDKLDG